MSIKITLNSNLISIFSSKGYIRDVSKSYKICIHIMTVIILVTFIMWSIEFLYIAFCKRRLTIAKNLQMQIIE